jgi:hypothetical protein
MALSITDLANPLIDALTFAIVAVSLYYVSKQKQPQYPYVKNLLVLVHVLFEGVIALEFMRNFITTGTFMYYYTVVASSLILWDVVLLTAIAFSVYVRPGGKGIAGRLRAIFVRWPHGVILGLFITFIAGSDAYLITARPYTIVNLISISGTVTTSTAFNGTFLAISLVVLLFFMSYPALLLFREMSQAQDPDVKRALLILPICWTGIGAELLLFNGYLITLGYDLIAVGYVIAALAFAVTASIFRRASLLSGFFEKAASATVPSAPFTSRLGPGRFPVESRSALLEVSSSASYEQAVRDFALEKTSGGGLVFVFTSKGSPVYNALNGINGVRFYVMTSKVSYPKPGPVESELLVPQNDAAVLLDLIDKTVSSTGDTPVAIVFDSVSDLILYLGFESSYKFLKQANEITDKPKVSALYLVTEGAHDERVTSMIRSIYPTHLAFTNLGLRVTKGAEAGRQR